ncbi:MAG: Na+/H+ antiporter NhaC family protein, partial [Oscillospiraceae bacterium]|nr:Na+/H+ antiporter NhaC family protein [Oscillospiraceae bacterium]
MEKKSTKIAYGVALCVIVVLLVALKFLYPDGVYGTVWSLLPPAVAIILALISKEVYSSLFLGVLTGSLLVANFRPWDTVRVFIGGGED